MEGIRLTALLLLTLFFLSLTAGASPANASKEQGQPPPEEPVNILLITADDLGLQVGAYGDTTARTPHLDRLAGEGMRLDRAYVTQASCSPSRSSILTGLYPHQNGQVGLANHEYHMRRGYENIPMLLKENGYRTGIIGKLHVLPEEAFPFDFERMNVGATRDVRGVARKAASFFRAAQGDPFFLYVNYVDPHLPFPRQVEGLPEEPFEANDVAPWPFNGHRTPEELEEIANYYSSVARLDAGVGMLLDELDQSGRAENTLVIFVSDHGPPFVRAKTTVYEAGVHVPFLVRWLGHTAPNMTSDALVSTIDILPTILDAAGLAVPDDLPGRSLVPLLTGKSVDWRDVLFTEYAAHTRNRYYPRRAIRNERYKLILNLLPDRPFPNFPYVSLPLAEEAITSSDARRAIERAAHPPAVELYDLKKDPVEFHNLAGNPEYRAIQEKMRARLRAWREQTDDPLRWPSILGAETWKHYTWKKDPE